MGNSTASHKRSSPDAHCPYHSVDQGEVFLDTRGNIIRTEQHGYQKHSHINDTKFGGKVEGAIGGAGGFGSGCKMCGIGASWNLKCCPRLGCHGCGPCSGCYCYL